MKTWRIFSWALISSLALLFVAGCGSGSGGGGAEDESFVLRGATAWPEDDIQSERFFLLKDKIEEESEGRVTIEYAGGPESIPPFELGEAVRNGIVDMATLSAAYYIPQMPAASVLDYSELSSKEELENGAMEYMNELHNETLNAQLLSRAGGGASYSIYTKEPVDSIEDFEGLRIRVSPVYVPFVEALGAEPIEMPGGEVYQALERGVIDGFTWPEYGIVDMGLQEQAGCKVEPVYWQVDTVNLMNLDAWNELPPDLQELVEQAAIEVNEEIIPERVDGYIADENEELEKAGVEICEIAEAEEYTQLASDSAWEWVSENVPPDQASRLEELFRK